MGITSVAGTPYHSKAAFIYILNFNFKIITYICHITIMNWCLKRAITINFNEKNEAGIWWIFVSLKFWWECMFVPFMSLLYNDSYVICQTRAVL